jgi:small ligand-binding sensory domain FIST
VNGWILLADPYTLDPEQMIALFSEAYPGLPVVGGMASGDFRQQRTYLFLNDRVLKEGALALPVGGDYTLKTVVSQGAMPVGEAWMVTAAERNIIFSISGRPAYEVLIETFRGLTPERQEQARRNLLVGLAVDEYKAEFGRGDFLIRNLMALDPASGAIAISAEPRIGQTIQFQLRDSAAADEDLRELLGKVTPALENNPPLAGVVFSCNGRGQGLFGTPDHDAHAINEQLGSLPLAGFFCNGEIGPVGSQTFLHGFTASLGLFVKK